MNKRLSLIALTQWLHSRAKVGGGGGTSCGGGGTSSFLTILTQRRGLNDNRSDRHDVEIDLVTLMKIAVQSCQSRQVLSGRAQRFEHVHICRCSYQTISL